MTTRLTTIAVLALCGLMFAAGCFHPPKEKFRSKKAIEANDYAQAERRLTAVLDRNPSDSEAHYLLGLTYLGQGRPLQAQSELEQALAVHNARGTYAPKVLDALAQAYHDQMRYEELYAFLDDQIQFHEGWQDYARKARFLALANDMDGAALAYRQAAYFSRNEDEAIYIEIADFYKGLGNQERELQALKWAYFINDENAELPDRFRSLGYAPGPTLKEKPPQPEYEGASLFGL